MTQLQLTHLRFDCTATTLIKLGGHYAGNSLRNALANVMRRAACPESQRRADPSPEHSATCPACWLLSSNLDPGTVVRAYAIAPPVPPCFDLSPGRQFSFTLTLFGDGFRYLPYFVLAIIEMGRQEGLGPGRREGLGRFTVDRITAVDPLQGASQPLLAAGDHFVTIPNLFINETAVAHATQHYLQTQPTTGQLTLQFLTPMRLEEDQTPYKTPDFAILFRRLLYRVDELGRQFAGQDRRPPAEVAHLHTLADQVRLVETQTEWHELWVHSSRKGRKTPLSGFTGTATYRADDWTPLLPWLIWGQASQIGKSAVKGNGVYQILNEPTPPYWHFLQRANAAL